jgi:hypothetical protein
MMELSRIEVEDIETIKKIHAKLGFDWQEPCLHIGTIKCVIGDQMIGAGFLRPTVEAVMILDPDSGKRDKARALYHMMRQAIDDTKAIKLDEIHAWIKEPEFVDVMKRHYCFVHPRGESLILKL